ncbi:MAG: hypothetical protein J2P23_13680 [Microlunatus sp.]|nr:hypothetical protein [Microlunatus sp.]
MPAEEILSLSYVHPESGDTPVRAELGETGEGVLIRSMINGIPETMIDTLWSALVSELAEMGWELTGEILFPDDFTGPGRDFLKIRESDLMAELVREA